LFVNKVPRNELTQPSTNIEKPKTPSPDNEYSFLSHQIEQEHANCDNQDNQVSLFDIQLYVSQNQKLSNKVKIEYFQKT